MSGSAAIVISLIPYQLGENAGVVVDPLFGAHGYGLWTREG